MKSKVFYLILVVAAAMLQSCSSNEENLEIWDVVPTSVRLDLTDAQGNTLLRADTEEGCKLISEVSVKYEGEVYSCTDLDEIMHLSRMYLAEFKGVYLAADYCYNPDDPMYGKPINWKLFFGDFQTEDNPNISFTVTWPDGESDEVEVKVKWKKGDRDVKMWINGKKQKKFGPVTHVLR